MPSSGIVMARTTATSLWETSTLLLIVICSRVFAIASVKNQDSNKLVIDSIKVGPQEISLFLTTYNATLMQVTVSVREDGITNKTILELFQIPALVENAPDSVHDHDIVHHAEHTVRSLLADTKYEMCVSASNIQHNTTSLLYERCYMVMTLPFLDNVSGIYPTLISVAIFLMITAFMWGIYQMFLHKYLSEFFTGNSRISTPLHEDELNAVQHGSVNNQRT